MTRDYRREPGVGDLSSAADVQPLEEGDPVRLGRFPLIGRLAAGGMGRVYLGRSLTDGVLVAIKSPLAEAGISTVDRRRFAREVKVARRAEGSRTARVLGADAEAEWPWLAFEYIPAPSLAELVMKAGILAGPAARWVTRGAVEAVCELHRHGIVHRDVKPQNLLLPLSGPRLIDFGISHAADLTRTQLTLGTVAFTSPEQARGEPSTAASDIYSLGATLFHLLVGRPPYPAGMEMPALLRYVAEADVDLTGLPGELAPLVRDCLALRPGDRPAAEELVNTLTAELAEMPTLASGEGWLPSSWNVIIEAYARQGRELAVDPRAALRAADASPERLARSGGNLPPPPGAAAPAAEAAPVPTAHLTTAPEDERPQPDKRLAGARSRGESVFVRSVQGLMATALLLLGGVLAYGYYQNRQAEQPGPIDRAFAGIKAGDCTLTGLDPAGRWLAPSPEITDCGAPGARWRVISSSDKGTADRCGAPYAAVSWNRSSRAGTVSLCLERMFYSDECVIGPQPDSAVLTEVTPLTNAPVFATTVTCSDTAPAGLAILRVLKYGLSDAACPPQTRVRYRFPDRGRMLCLTTV
ncbi:serine/threonine protein kinase [Streptomyces sp. NBC_01276]|uniref:serine/threonine protein kinase n=1 Tax=Streptomyces sp. NBC_01276 TaxID=2903808 RepID=UPI00352D111F